MRKYAIYTIMVGSYGEIYQPLAIDERFDYILFSNNITQDVGIWKIRSFPEPLHNDNKRLSRYPKTHPVSLLPEYEASLYLDANVQILDGWVYERFIELLSSDALIAGVQLTLTGRDCIYEHSYDMCAMKAEHDYNAIKQMHTLRKRGFPDHFGLNENNLIWRRHNARVKAVDDEWWWWITHYSFRDQFSYMYCFWKYGVDRVFFLPAGEDTGNSVHFRRIQHNEQPEVAAKKWIHTGFFEEKRNLCRTKNNYYYQLYCKHWVALTKLPFPRMALFVWGVLICGKHYIKFRLLKGK